MYVDIVISNAFNLNKHFFFYFSFFINKKCSTCGLYCCIGVANNRLDFGEIYRKGSENDNTNITKISQKSYNLEPEVMTIPKSQPAFSRMFHSMFPVRLNSAQLLSMKPKHRGDFTNSILCHIEDVNTSLSR